MVYSMCLHYAIDHLIDTEEGAWKMGPSENSLGGTVWETVNDVLSFRDSMPSLRSLTVYGVDADWDKDTMIPPNCSGPHRRLTRPARLIRLSSDGLPRAAASLVETLTESGIGHRVVTDRSGSVFVIVKLGLPGEKHAPAEAVFEYSSDNRLRRITTGTN